MFSIREKQWLAGQIEKLLLELKHPEMPTEKPSFVLRVNGKEALSWAEIHPNWIFGVENPPAVNPWNEQARDVMK